MAENSVFSVDIRYAKHGWNKEVLNSIVKQSFYICIYISSVRAENTSLNPSDKFGFLLFNGISTFVD